MKKTILFIMASVFLAAFNASAEEEIRGDLTTPEVVADLLWVRPLGVLHVGLGALFYAVSLPVTLPLKKEDEVKEFLITYPYYYYFKRPLREM